MNRQQLARQMQTKTLCRIVKRAVENRHGNGTTDKWKKIIHAVGYGASLKSIMTGRIK